MDNDLWDDRNIHDIYRKESQKLVHELKDSIDHECEDGNWIMTTEEGIGRTIEEVYEYSHDVVKDDTIDKCRMINALTDEDQIKEIDKDEGLYEYILEPSMSVKNYYNFKYKL